jgi:hypothetical protein
MYPFNCSQKVRKGVRKLPFSTLWSTVEAPKNIVISTISSIHLIFKNIVIIVLFITMGNIYKDKSRNTKYFHRGFYHIKDKIIFITIAID